MGFFKDLGKGMQNAKDAAASQQGNWGEQKAYADSINNPQGPPLQENEPGKQSYAEHSIELWREANARR